MKPQPTIRQQILNEPAGPTMDRWVGEIILGIRVRRRPRSSGAGWVYDLVIPGGVDREGFPGPDDPWAACPAYSSDIAAAMDVAKLSTSNIELRRIRHHDGSWRWLAHLRFSGSTGEAFCDDLPLAICHAALLSKLSL